MKQVNYNQYGSSDVLKVTEVPKSSARKKGHVLVKISFSSLNAIDWKNRKGQFKIFSGWFSPRTKQGFDIVGTIEATSDDVTHLKKGDRVVGLLGNFSGGGISEYVSVHSYQLVKVPERLDEKQLAGLPMAGSTAWQALLDLGKLKAGHKVLINGGSSGVGHLAIQIAKAYGAEVTSVSSGPNISFCKQLGADNTIDYQKEDFKNASIKYDIIFDVVFNTSLSKVMHILQPKGIYIGTTPSFQLIKDILFTRQAKFVAVKPDKGILKNLVQLMENNQLKVVIDRIYPMHQIVEAHQYMEQSKTKGKLIIKII